MVIKKKLQAASHKQQALDIAVGFDRMYLERINYANKKRKTISGSTRSSFS